MLYEHCVYDYTYVHTGGVVRNCSVAVQRAQAALQATKAAGPVPAVKGKATAVNVIAVVEWIKSASKHGDDGPVTGTRTHAISQPIKAVAHRPHGAAEAKVAGSHCAG